MEQVDDIERWLFDESLPLWATTGADGQHGFAERLELSGEPTSVPFKRLRVQARQVYVYSHAAALGHPRWLALADRGWQFMEEHGLRPGGGWVRSCGRTGGVLDSTLDLYDQAFGMLAAAWRFRVTGDVQAIERARGALRAIDAELASSTGHGWLSDSGPTGELLQNPHMHLLEAALALHAATGEREFAELVDRLVTLFNEVLFDRTTGTLAEYFSADWTRAAGERGRIVEPGHHYEWVWLLHQASPLIPGAEEHAEALFDFARRHGSGATEGSIINEVLDDGAPRDRGTRTWPLTEAIKAHVARFEHTGHLDDASLGATIGDLRSRFLGRPLVGAWIDQHDASGEPSADKIPASTLYHVFLGVVELSRLPGLLEARR